MTIQENFQPDIKSSASELGYKKNTKMIIS